ncbi:MAG TPA: hypothetical protein VEQ65_13200 [Opitutus sp.]|nr:hypothetical protein [Opitutus sp.]
MPTVLYIGQNPTAGTGSPIIILRHLQRFAADGWKVSVLGDYGGDYRECRAAGWQVRQLCHRRWWWPPYRKHSASLRWLRLRLLAYEAAAAEPAPDVILSYLAAHSDFSTQLAGHVAQITGAPLHVLVHDDATAFPAARGREAETRRTHEAILAAADTCWFVSPELADCYPSTAPRRRILYPIPEGWDRPAVWREENAARARVYYAGHVWPEQLPLLQRIGTTAAAAGSELAIMARESPALREICQPGSSIRWHAPFPSNREALAHLVADASGVIVSYADSVAQMPWCATSFPSKLVEYCHLGLPVAIVAPTDSAVARWAQRVRFPYFFEPGNLQPLQDWFAGLRQRDVWQVRAALSLHLARTEFDPRRIQAELANALLPGTERRAA